MSRRIGYVVLLSHPNWPEPRLWSLTYRKRQHVEDHRQWLQRSAGPDETFILGELRTL